MILMPQIFDVTANENARYKRNELECVFFISWFVKRPAEEQITQSSLCMSSSDFSPPPHPPQKSILVSSDRPTLIFCPDPRERERVRDWLFNVTWNDISVIYVTAHRCAGGLKKKLDLRSGSQRHRHFVGFFNVPVQAPTRDHPFYTVIPTHRPI